MTAPNPNYERCDACESEGRNCTAHGGRPGIPYHPTPNPDYERRCYACGRAEDHTRDERGKFTVELRPYGPGGADVCFHCATASIDAEAQTARAFATLLDATEAISDGPVMIGVDTNGPIPFNPSQIDGSGGVS